MILESIKFYEHVEVTHLASGTEWHIVNYNVDACTQLRTSS